LTAFRDPTAPARHDARNQQARGILRDDWFGIWCEIQR